MARRGLTPAALSALVKGDLDNAMTAMEPGGIERQEAAGQVMLCASGVLPKRCNYCERSDLEALGVVYGDDKDDLFVNVTLPAGWAIVPTDHSMWSKLVDETGKERASIFYKAAFYDRSAFVSLVRNEEV